MVRNIVHMQVRVLTLHKITLQNNINCTVEFFSETKKFTTVM